MFLAIQGIDIYLIRYLEGLVRGVVVILKLFLLNRPLFFNINTNSSKNLVDGEAGRPSNLIMNFRLNP